MVTAIKTAKQKNLGMLSLTKPVRVVLLPSEASGVIVNHSKQSGLRITSVFKKTEHKVSIRGSTKLKIKTPPMLMSVVHADFPSVTGNWVSNYYIYGFYDKDKTMVWAAPYVLSNVYSKGRICFGNHRPKDLRAAYNIFWQAKFNGELAHHSEDLVYKYGADIDVFSTTDFMKNYQKEIFDSQDWEDMTPVICGSKFLAIKNPSEALLITRNQELLKQIPKKHWKKQGGQAFIILQAKRYPDFWMFANEKLVFKLPLDAVSTGPAKTRAYY